MKAELVTEYAVEILWVDHVAAGAESETSVPGWFADRARVERFRDTQRRDRAVKGTRILTRQAVYTEPESEMRFEMTTDEVRNAALARMWD